MTKIAWDKIGERYYQYGIDRGVLYSTNELVTIEDESYPKGFPWNGLVSVDEDRENVSVTPIYFDGKKTLDLVSSGDFSATLKSITYPDEFTEFSGYEETMPGVFVDGQARGTFGLSYRTKLGNDLNGVLGYKIHILYNLTALVDITTSQTTDSNIEPITFSWKLTSVSQDVLGYAPSAHLILDSTKIDSDILLAIEAILYGDETNEPRLPSLLEIFSSMTLVVFMIEGGRFVAWGPEEIIEMLDSQTWQITSNKVEYLDADTYQFNYIT